MLPPSKKERDGDVRVLSETDAEVGSGNRTAGRLLTELPGRP